MIPNYTSLLISTYNWPEALQLVLRSVMCQEYLPDEIVIADDGSTSDTGLLIESFRSQLEIPIIHVWHEDVGFTKAKILNKAVAKAKGDYIIQIDGDCIMHPHFIKDHLDFSTPNGYLYGSRVNIKESFLDQLFADQKIRFNPFSKGIYKRTRAMHCKMLAKLYRPQAVFSKKYRGCNTSFYKSDFIAVNGYDEEFVGWGREDSELALRFLNYGLTSRRLRYVGIVYHIYHPEKSKDRLDTNNAIELKTIREKRFWCEHGIDKYLSEAV